MPVTQSIKWCTRCGAVTGISSSEGGGFDNEQKHAEWHDRQDELIAQFQAMGEALGAITVTYWNQVCLPFAQAVASSVLPKVKALGEALKQAQGETGQVPPPHQDDCPALLDPLDPLGPCACEPPERYGDE